MGISVGLDTATIEAHAGYIFSDLEDTDAVETASDAADNEYDFIRGKNLNQEQLKDTGWANQYRFSVYAQRTDISSLAIGNLLTFAEGELRILDIVDMPFRVWRRLDLGGKFDD